MSEIPNIPRFDGTDPYDKGDGAPDKDAPVFSEDDLNGFADQLSRPIDNQSTDETKYHKDESVGEAATGDIESPLPVGDEVEEWLKRQGFDL